ncbi:hypothetical protein LX36DRAFT_109410 [Colletotrichum falcatum]|nr:hypothetical protein LX36DRAFT_109410 [Colletotrichum falcatum]
MSMFELPWMVGLCTSRLMNATEYIYSRHVICYKTGFPIIVEHPKKDHVSQQNSMMRRGGIEPPAPRRCWMATENFTTKPSALSMMTRGPVHFMTSTPDEVQSQDQDD